MEDPALFDRGRGARHSPLESTVVGASELTFCFNGHESLGSRLLLVASFTQHVHECSDAQPALVLRFRFGVDGEKDYPRARCIVRKACA